MQTEVLTAGNIDRAAEIIRRGGLVAVPTETVYGLAGNGLDADAVERIYAVKGRPEVKPLSLMVHGAEAMGRCWSSVPGQALSLAEEFWPGPLTIIGPGAPGIPDIVRAGGSTVGLRCPDHELTLELLEKCGVPLAAPSANPSGAPSPKTAQEVLGYFNGKIDAVIDGGECGTGTGKTTALDVLRGMGALCIDADELYHALTLTSQDMKAELIARFGAVYDGDTLNRRALGDVVFSDPAALEDLNAVTHKYVTRETFRLLREFAMGGGTVAAIDAIGIFEAGLDSICAAVFGVLAPEDVRLERIMTREGIPREYALKRIRAQKSDEYYKDVCTACLVNDGTREEFAARCEAAFKEAITHGRKERLPRRALL